MGKKVRKTHQVPRSIVLRDERYGISQNVATKGRKKGWMEGRRDGRKGRKEGV